MDTITLIFTHPQAELPKYIFSDRVAVTNDCLPNSNLVLKSSILNLQSQRQIDVEAKICSHCDRGRVNDSSTGQNNQCTDCCDTKLKDFAKKATLNQP